MAELLQRESPELDQAICDHQGSSNPQLRKRIHQLESVRLIRQKRQQLQYHLHYSNLSLFEGCLQLHLSLPDSEYLEEKIREKWERLKTSFRKNPVQTLQQMTDFLQNETFQYAEIGELHEGQYCIGTVLDSGNGSDLLLSVIACLLAEEANLSWQVGRYGPYFGFTDNRNGIVMPAMKWTILPDSELNSACVLWTKEHIFKFIAAQFYFCAIGTNSFRNIYIQTLNLEGITKMDQMDELPYPYITNHATEKSCK